MRTDNRQPMNDHLPLRRGFTLVEMMVATALVMLMMLLFAEVFEAAIGTMTAQRGIANNDQKARSFTTVMRHDLDGLTYQQSASRGAMRELVPGVLLIRESTRGIVPLAPGDVVDPNQLGYVYISENDVDDDTDDVLQFTSRVPINGVQSPFFGRARFLEEPDFTADPNQFNPNQPERDDGISRNSASSSRRAEISYSVRGGNLYRRVMLIRDPLPGDPPFSAQPTAGPDGTAGPFTYPSSSPGPAGPPFFNQPYAATFPALPVNSFYNDWDFSGTRVFANDTNTNSAIDPEPTDEYRFHFHGVDSLDNAQGTANTPLGIPWNRFGFYSRFGINRPVEFLFNASAGPVYIGRFTHEETSHGLFGWPGIEEGPGTGGNIMIRDDLVLSPIGVVSEDRNTNGIYDAGDFSLLGGRAGEDILLTNVEAFDIEVWDPGFLENAGANGVPGFQPFDPQDDPNGNGVQDAGLWVDVGNSFPLGFYRAAARANVAYGPGGPAGNHVYDTWHTDGGVDFDVSGTVDPAEQQPPYRPLQIDPADTVVVPDWTAAGGALGEVLFPDGPSGNFTFGFVVIQAGAKAGTEPTWIRTPGTIIDDGTARWQCFDNRIGLERIRITVRYRDVSTQQARQVTLVHSLADVE